MATRRAEGRYDVTEKESLWILAGSTATVCLVVGAVNQTALPLTCGAKCEVKPLYLHGPKSFNFVTLFLAFSAGATAAFYTLTIADATGVIDTITVNQDPLRSLPYEDSYILTIQVI